MLALRILVPLVIALAAPACAHPRTAADRPPGDGDSRTPSVLRVTNHNWLDVTVYVQHDGARSRVGLVTAASTRTFVLPRRLIGADGSIFLVGEPVGTLASVASDVLHVLPGQPIEWTLESDLERSSASVAP